MTIFSKFTTTTWAIKKFAAVKKKNFATIAIWQKTWRGIDCQKFAQGSFAIVDTDHQASGHTDCHNNGDGLN